MQQYATFTAMVVSSMRWEKGSLEAAALLLLQQQPKRGTSISFDRSTSLKVLRHGSEESIEVAKEFKLQGKVAH
ncbi:hypothetical protein IEQ34_005233 [Dendrobium chrysotoxum]|uniref:Uncharacterized protein n=1 Tax=Dendrobium chrysotoxum TaxID=161865 RepID=A0AAV7HAI0_DENCH|nr:hypothetical protein IEQ34_005233 [Dendrobium chrysotoxum]